MRGIAAVGVTLFWHYSHFGPYRPFEGFAAEWLYRYGWMLVDFFFVLSGFVLSHAYLEKLADRRVRPYEFFILRFSRLYPLHLVTLLFVATLQFYRTSSGMGSFVYHENDLFHFFLNLGFLQQGIIRTEYSFNGPAWSLTVEELSYLMFFVSMFFFAAYRRLAFLVLVGVGILINMAALHVHVFNLEVSRGLVGFFGGCLAYQLHHFAREKNQSFRLAALASIALIGVVSHYVQSGYPRSAQILLIHSLVIFPAIVLIVLNAPPLKQLMSFRPLAYVGEISYSLYMIHFPVQLVLDTVGEANQLGFRPGRIEFFILYAALTVAASVASFHFFERPAQAIIRRSLMPSFADRSVRAANRDAEER
jgi:peptidoglycan/LPS O-acetylase OafA/YrhL